MKSLLSSYMFVSMHLYVRSVLVCVCHAVSLQAGLAAPDLADSVAALVRRPDTQPATLEVAAGLLGRARHRHRLVPGGRPAGQVRP